MGGEKAEQVSSVCTTTLIRLQASFEKYGILFQFTLSETAIDLVTVVGQRRNISSNRGACV
jgi:hypothetical protein